MIEEYLDKAFRIIRRNYGCPGDDGITIKQIKKNYLIHKSFLETSLRTKSFKFKYPRSAEIIDYRQNPRLIYVYSVYDRWVQQCIKLLIMPYVEVALSPCSFSDRRGYNHYDAFSYILKDDPMYVLKLDIASFNAKIDRLILFSLLNSVHIPLEATFMIQESFSHLAIGIPPGNVLSPILSNLYLSLLDKHFPDNYARFSDDLFFALSSESQMENIITRVSHLLHLIGLELNWSKTKLIRDPTQDKLL